MWGFIMCGVSAGVLYPISLMPYSDHVARGVLAVIASVFLLCLYFHGNKEARENTAQKVNTHVCVLQVVLRISTRR